MPAYAETSPYGIRTYSIHTFFLPITEKDRIIEPSDVLVASSPRIAPCSATCKRRLGSELSRCPLLRAMFQTSQSRSVIAFWNWTRLVSSALRLTWTRLEVVLPNCLSQSHYSSWRPRSCTRFTRYCLHLLVPPLCLSDIIWKHAAASRIWKGFLRAETGYIG